MKRIINIRKCEPETVAVAVIPAAGSACTSSRMVVPPPQADRPPLDGETPQDWPGGILRRGRRWEQAGKPHRPSESQTWLKTRVQRFTQPRQ